MKKNHFEYIKYEETQVEIKYNQKTVAFMHKRSARVCVCVCDYERELEVFFFIFSINRFGTK